MGTRGMGGAGGDPVGSMVGWGDAWGGVGGGPEGEADCVGPLASEVGGVAEIPEGIWRRVVVGAGSAVGDAPVTGAV